MRIDRGNNISKIGREGIVRQVIRNRISTTYSVGCSVEIHKIGRLSVRTS